MKYFAFGIAPSMFPSNCTITRKAMTPAEVQETQATLTSALNPSHRASIDAMSQRFNICVPIPQKAPVVSLGDTDSVIVMGIQGLPRLEGRHEYTDEEVASATFTFSEWIVSAPIAP